MGASISIRDLTVRFDGTTALDGVTLDVAPGTVLGVLGPNGAGKTTLIRVLATQTRPTSGTAAVAGYDVVEQRREVQRRIGVTGQYAALDDDLTVAENLRLVADLAGMDRRAAADSGAALASLLDLPDERSRLGQLSGGTRRRVDLAVGLLTEPDVVILDEPTTGLDPRSREQLWNVVADLAGAGVTVVLTTQYLEEADRLADRIVFLHHGRVVDDGSPAEVKARIGGQVLTIRLRTSADLGRTQLALAAWKAAVDVEPATLRLTATVPDARSTLELAAALEALPVDIEELLIGTASLDDAFRELTAA